MSPIHRHRPGGGAATTGRLRRGRPVLALGRRLALARRGPGYRRRLAVTVAVLSMVSLAAVPAAQAATSGEGSAAAGSAGGSAAGRSAAPRADSGWVPAGDEVVTAKVDSAGYHLFAASSGDGWAWHAPRCRASRWSTWRRCSSAMRSAAIRSQE